MGAKQFYTKFREIFERLEKEQDEVIAEVAEWAADAIACDRFVLVFGTGHSAIPAMDVYPRIGSYPGWLPIHELCTSYIATVLGNQGLRQAMFLEKVDGFGKLVLENYRLDPRDIMIVISNSGVNTMGIEIALEVKKQGLKTVAITSLEHSRASRSYHKTGKRLFEVCDRTLDTCMPQGDALVEIQGLPYKVAAASSIAGSLVLQALAAETALKLAERGKSLPVFPSHNAKMSPEEEEAVEAMVSAVLAEHARRTAGFYQ